ncbi:nucleotide exchange factor GrpE [Methanosarcina sp. UBA411]|jgi:molecular chaperone GrpE (heat shock protein)|uniref:nucleotide exchange factor GrpE n=1 Tax=Methanosarcina sp. UBA411 TaxID=1915589 RepID=UPI0025DC46B9|nr:nucleotide exchange factor GrpE [Methanosarcina sp. UBA411]
MNNTNKEEPSASQNVINTVLPEEMTNEVAGTVVSNEEIKEEALISDEFSASESDEQNAEECTEEEPKKAENVSVGNDNILQRIIVLSDKMDSLNLLFSEKIRNMEDEEKIIDQMHKGLQKYKDDMYAQLIRQVLLDIIEVRDSILRIADFYLKKPEGEQSIPYETFAGYALDIQDILEKNGVEIYKSSHEDNFVPVKQRAIKKVVTENKELHGKVAESLSCGYNYNGRTISAEKIAFYYYEEPGEIITKYNEEKVQNG